MIITLHLVAKGLKELGESILNASTMTTVCTGGTRVNRRGSCSDRRATRAMTTKSNTSRRSSRRHDTFLKFSLGSRRIWVSDSERLMLDILEKFFPSDLLNDMHDVGSIGIMHFGIPYSYVDFGPHVMAYREMNLAITNLVKHLRSLLQQISGFTNLRIESGPEHIIEDKVVGPEPRSLEIRSLVGKIHVLNVLRNQMYSIMKKGRGVAVLFAKPKQP
jgi:hypothetical protein